MTFNSDSLLSTEERNGYRLNPVNLSSLNKLAKLFATEDLTVVHDPSAHTAMFNTVARTLVLPAWKDMPKVVYLLFTGHEIGHAIWTPNDAFDNPLIPAAYKDLAGYQSVLNVTEDVRIEKRVKRKYPGLRADFVEGYRRLVDAGFFGDSLAEVAASPNVVDRLNVRFKLGSDAASMIPFHDDVEISFLDRGYALESFDEAVLLANDIYEHMLDNEEPEDSQDESDDGFGEPCEDDGSGEDGDSFDPDTNTPNDDDSPDGRPGDDGDPSDSDDESSGSGSSSSDDDSGSDSGSDSDSGDDDDDSNSDGDIGAKDAGKGNSANPDFDPSSETDRASRENTKFLADPLGSATRRCAIPYDRVDYREYVHDTKQILDEFVSKVNLNLPGGRSDVFFNELATECKRYVSSIKPVVSLMAKEFDMKKAADQHRRSSTARTGVINVGKLHAYKYEEDLFLRKSIMPDAKNHGMVMLLDLSGSMVHNMAGTLEQLINLVLFCKRVQIPFEVYGFNDALWHDRGARPDNAVQYNHDDVRIDGEVYLRKFISSDLKANMFKKALEYLCMMKSFWSAYTGQNLGADWLDNYYMRLPDADNLGSTPLNDALILASGIINNFRDRTGVQVCNLVILSDGDSNHLALPRGGDALLYDELTRRSMGNEYVADRTTKHTAFILDGLKARTDARIVGFFVLSPSARKAKSELARLVRWDAIEDAYATLKKDGAVVTGCHGYDVRFAIRGGSSLKVEDSNALDSVADGAKVTQIRAAFKKGSKGKIKSRVLLKKFIETIA